MGGSPESQRMAIGRGGGRLQRADVGESEYRDTPSARNRYGDGQGDWDRGWAARCLYFSRKHYGHGYIRVARGSQLCARALNFATGTFDARCSPGSNFLRSFVLRRTLLNCLFAVDGVWVNSPGEKCVT